MARVQWTPFSAAVSADGRVTPEFLRYLQSLALDGDGTDGEIAGLQSSVASLGAVQATQAAQIAVNTGSIAANASGIASNASDIAALAVRVSALEAEFIYSPQLPAFPAAGAFMAAGY